MEPTRSSLLVGSLNGPTFSNALPVSTVWMLSRDWQSVEMFGELIGMLDDPGPR
jgi:hypothetical protein